MLTKINNLPPRLVGVHAYADVTGKEYEVMLVELFDKQLKSSNRLNFVLVLETSIEKFISGAWCGNIRVGLRYFFKWNRVAIVTDRQDVLDYNHLFRYLLPGKYKRYKLNQLDSAIQWASVK